MKVRKVVWTVAVMLVCSGTGAPAAQGEQESAATVAPRQHDQQRGGDERRQPRRSRWWMEAKDREELGISDQQSAQIEAIWQSTFRAQVERWREHQKLEPVVEQLIKEGTAEPEYVAQQVQRLHALNAEMTATRVITLYKMMRELTPAQREKLKRMQERRDAEPRKTTDSQQRR
jgi:hypothetical protein